MMGTYSYFKGDDFIPNPLFSRAVFLMISAIMCLAVLSVFTNKKIPVLTENGKDTLFFFVYHAFVYRLLRLLYIEYSIEQKTVNLILGSALVILILMAMKKIRVLWWLLNPITKTIAK